ncbi:PHD-zinc-finger like domain-containing protein [Phycomyces nitens]|nr:PHD-zinc-finger like domain-containing protein [Phycomyces nitens]
MDEQDEAWLQLLNTERNSENLGEVSGDLFESIVDQLEKEWFDLIKTLPKQNNDEPALPEDSTCAICDDGECENSNAIVFCDGCNLAVHQDCYGIPYIPEGQWLCRKCMVSPENPVSCLFCPNEGGAFKQTNTNKWGHLLCAIWIPEVGLSNSVYMEPIDNIDKVPRSRWKLTCYICRRREGACIQCDHKQCFVAFHVTCARWARLCMRMKSHSLHCDGVVLKAFCDRHTPRDYREEVDVEQNVLAAQSFYDGDSRLKKGGQRRVPRRRHIDEDLEDERLLNISSSLQSEEEDTMDKNKKRKRPNQDENGDRRLTSGGNTVAQLLPSSKAARAHQHHYSAGAPIAPESIISKLEELRCVKQAGHLRKKPQLITSICRYWSLKRESRRGAPLLKRLHLEPWTASFSQHKQTEVEKARRNKATQKLRGDLEKLRMLSEQVRKREKQKLERMRKQKAYIETILFPVEYIIKPVLVQLMEIDKKDMFHYPVTAEVAPDYNDIIKNPMSFFDIRERLSAHKYTSLDQFEGDIKLIWKNSMTYNKPDTMYFKMAQKLEKTAEELMVQARIDYNGLQLTKETGILDLAIDPEIFTYKYTQLPTPEEIAAENLEKERVTKKAEEEANLAKELAIKNAENQAVADMLKSAQAAQVAQEAQEVQTIQSIDIVHENHTIPVAQVAQEIRTIQLVKEPRNIIHQSGSDLPAETVPVKDLKSDSSLAEISPASGESPLSEGLQMSEASSLSEDPHLSEDSPSEEQQPSITEHDIPAEDQAVSEEIDIESPKSPDREKQGVAAVEALSCLSEVTHTSDELHVLEVSSPSLHPENQDNVLPEDSNTEAKNEPKVEPRRLTRSMGTKGLVIPTEEELSKRSTAEARRLVWPSSMAGNQKPVFKEDPKHPGSRGWIYVVDDDDDGDDETDEEIKRPKKVSRREKTVADIMGNRPRPVLKPGDIVWARVPGYPSHPAKIVDMAQDDIPPQVLRVKHRRDYNTLVHFIDVIRTEVWGWVPDGNIEIFGDKDIDELMLRKVKKEKQLHKRKEVQAGFRSASKLKHIDPEPLLDLVFSPNK